MFDAWFEQPPSAFGDNPPDEKTPLARLLWDAIKGHFQGIEQDWRGWAGEQKAAQDRVMDLPEDQRLRATLENAIPFALGFGPGSLASRSPMLYNPPAKAQRPFAEDYRSGAQADAAGRLAHDIEGRPLTAEYVAGRRMVGGDDEALSAAQSQSAGERSVGARYQAYPAAEMPRGTSGFYRQRRNNQGLAEHAIGIRRDLSPAQAGRVLQHETAHLIDEVAGQVPTKSIDADLRKIYNTLNTGQERTRNLTGPQHLGYKGDDVPRELMAEAIRAYMADPNYLKTVSPEVAKRIREHVNTHPTLSKIIQFNALAGLLGGAGAVAAGNPYSEPQQ